MIDIAHRPLMATPTADRAGVPAEAIASSIAAQPASTTAASSNSGNVNIMPEQPVEKTTASAPDSSSLPDSSAAQPAFKVLKVSLSSSSSASSSISEDEAQGGAKPMDTDELSSRPISGDLRPICGDLRPISGDLRV